MIPNSYFERFQTAKYRSRNPIQRGLIRRFAATAYALVVDAGPVESVLEIGVGEGFLSGFLSEQLPGARFTGIDVDEQDLSRLRQRFPRIEARAGNAYDLEAAVADRRPFDLVLCCEVLEHLDDPDRALDQIAGLSPRRVVVSVPHEPFFMLSNLLRGKNVSRLGNDIGHVNHFGVRAFRRLLEHRFAVLRLTRSYPWIVALLAPR